MSDETNPGDKATKKKNKRQRGGFALVEFGEDGNVVTIIAGGFPGQRECREHLIAMVQEGTIKVEEQRAFGIIQVKAKDLAPKVTNKVSL